jgi:hypothetical protein
VASGRCAATLLLVEEALDQPPDHGSHGETVIGGPQPEAITRLWRQPDREHARWVLKRGRGHRSGDELLVKEQHVTRRPDWRRRGRDGRPRCENWAEESAKELVLLTRGKTPDGLQQQTGHPVRLRGLRCSSASHRAISLSISADIVAPLLARTARRSRRPTDLSGRCRRPRRRCCRGWR